MNQTLAIRPAEERLEDTMINKLRTLLTILILAFGAVPPVTEAEDGVHASVVTDEDDDEAILMESEWISMHLLPWRQALINRFVFRPTGNDIVAPTNPKHRMGGGGGILMDCLWEQDWRFQELAYKQYKYKVTKNGPDEAQVVFETDITGWLGSDNSGMVSNLLSNLTLRRMVTLKAGQPFFRFDIEFINNDRWAKRPTFWVHNNSILRGGSGKDTVVRPTDAALAAIGGDQEAYAGPQGMQFIDNFTHGWSAKLSKERREGIVYLMDFDYVGKLYNCFENHGESGTSEWWYNSILSFSKQPWKGRVYILPMIGLSRVDHANPHFICAMEPRREEGQLVVDFALTSSYESAAQVTLVTEVRYNLAGEKPATVQAEPLIIDNLAIQPTRARLAVELDAPDPLLFKVKAFVELPEGDVKTYTFQRFYTGDYRLKSNIRNVGAGPLVTLDRPVQNPLVPPVPAGLSINRKDFKVFGIHGVGTLRLGLEQAVKNDIPAAVYETGYCVGFDAPQNGLTDFPYDYERLYDHRVLVLSNVQDREFRRVGASILLPWLEAGGGLVMVGGPFAFSFEHREHPINSRYPFVPQENTLRRGPLQLQPPDMPDHPIFAGIKLDNLPWLHFYHDLDLKKDSGARVLMRVGDQPFIVERVHEKQRTIAVTINPFGKEAFFDGKLHVRNWDQWPNLFVNIVKYAGHGN
ncbi:MAG: hypothetical protein O3B01_16800 [Planctomycetota bacterium]|nr:hypothetical protein [Planctomycetota bacterium]MDA1140236.1 hypothetical protein [Planctomycetota bacterium]